MMKLLINVIVFVAFLTNVGVAHGALRRVGRGESCAYADKSGRVVIPEGRYLSGCSKIKSPVMLQSAMSDSCFWVDATGAELFSVCMVGSRADGFEDGRMRVERGGLVGFVDKKGRVVVPLAYSSAERFVGNHALVARAGSVVSSTDGGEAPVRKQFWGVIDKKGREVKPLVYERHWVESDGIFYYATPTETFRFTEKGEVEEVNVAFVLEEAD